MNVAINRVVEHDGKEYHIHCEDLGQEAACFDIRVLLRGGVLWQKRIPYGELLDPALAPGEREHELHLLMEKTVATAEMAIARGKLG